MKTKRAFKNIKRSVLFCFQRTFTSTNDAEQLLSICRELSKKTVDELISDQIICKKVTLKMKTSQFEVLTRSKTLNSYTDSLDIITDKAISILKSELEHDLELPALRLMGKKMQKAKQTQLLFFFYFEGVRVSDLKPKSTDSAILQFFTKKLTTDDEESNHDVIEATIEPSVDEENPTLCPLCQKTLIGGNDKINQHIDLCLNGEIVRSTIREQTQGTNSNKR